MVLSVKFDGGNDAEATGRLTLDGALAFEGAMQTGRDPNGSVWAVVGIHDVWGGPGPAVTATFDNVLITSP